MFVLLWLLRRRMGGIDGQHLLVSLGKSGIAAAAMGGLVWLWMRLAPALGILGKSSWGIGLGGIAIAAVGYGIVSILLKSEELQPAMAAILRKK